MQPYFLVHFEIVLHKVSSSYQRKCFDKLRIGFIITNDDHSWSIIYIDIFISIHKNHNNVWDNKHHSLIVKTRFAIIDSTVHNRTTLLTTHKYLNQFNLWTKAMV